jgi:hypothetical protein
MLSHDDSLSHAERFLPSDFVTTTFGVFLVPGFDRNKAAIASARVIGYVDRGS